ncbi:hypothetical protein VZT92_008321 [Zoarces viviparus]|uniref:Uncharacterized protein n=1 Tax=Zoarces viviparus TaxID=48416 RepID=A0AAW1FE55_ZOAVI
MVLICESLAAAHFQSQPSAASAGLDDPLFLPLFSNHEFLPCESPGNSNPPVISSLGPQRREGENRLVLLGVEGEFRATGDQEEGAGWISLRGVEPLYSLFLPGLVKFLGGATH